MNFPVLPVLEEIEAIAAMGMDYIELAMDPPNAHYTQLQNQRKEIQRALNSHGLGLVCHLPTFVHTADLTESIRKASIQEVLNSLETATELGAEKVVLHPSYIRGLAVHVLDQALGLAMESLGLIWQHADRFGIVVCIENMFSALTPFVEPEDFEPVFTAFPGLKLVLDTGHAFIGDKSGRRIIKFIDRFSHCLSHVHVSDNAGTYDEHLPMGYGKINFKAVARALHRAGYNDTITLEIFGQDASMLIKNRQRLVKIFNNL